MGRYVFEPEIFDYLENLDIGYGGEIQLTDAIKKLAQEKKFWHMHLREKDMMLAINLVL